MLSLRQRQQSGGCLKPPPELDSFSTFHKVSRLKCKREGISKIPRQAPPFPACCLCCLSARAEASIHRKNTINGQFVSMATQYYCRALLMEGTVFTLISCAGSKAIELSTFLCEQQWPICSQINLVKQILHNHAM